MTPFELLRSMTSTFPPPEAKHHSLTLDGDALLLTIWVGEKALGFGLDTEDFAKPIERVVSEIQGLVQSKKRPLDALLEATRRDRKGAATGR